MNINIKFKLKDAVSLEKSKPRTYVITKKKIMKYELDTLCSKINRSVPVNFIWQSTLNKYIDVKV